jgi:hypothetical protein
MRLLEGASLQAGFVPLLVAITAGEQSAWLKV